MIFQDAWRSLEVSGKKVHILTTGRGIVGDRVVFSVRKSFAQTHPDETTKAVRAIVNASRFIMANRDEAAAIIAKFLRLDLPSTKQIMEILNFDPTYSPKFRADMEWMSSFMLSQKALTRPVDWTVDFAPQFLKAVDPGLVK